MKVLALPSFGIIPTLKVADTTVVVMFGPTHDIAAGRMGPAVVAVHQASLDNSGSRIKMRWLKSIVACQQRGDTGLVYLVEIKLICHGKAAG